MWFKATEKFIIMDLIRDIIMHKNMVTFTFWVSDRTMTKSMGNCWTLLSVKAQTRSWVIVFITVRFRAMFIFRFRC